MQTHSDHRFANIKFKMHDSALFDLINRSTPQENRVEGGKRVGVREKEKDGHKTVMTTVTAQE